MGEQRFRKRLLVYLILLLLVLQIPLLLRRVYDVDEMEHVHAGVCVAWGMVPYRDFFEHHPPLTYWLSGLLISLTGPETDLLTLHRLLSLGFTCLTSLGTYKLGKQLYGERAGLWSVVFLLIYPSFIEKSVEWRPDVLATCGLVWSAWLMSRPVNEPWRTALPAGLLLSLALICTPKSVFLIVGLGAAGLATRVARDRGISGHILGGLIGAAFPLLLAACVLWFQGAIVDAIENTVLLPIRWPVQVIGGDFLLGRRSWAPAQQSLAAIAILPALASLRRRSTWERGRALAIMPVISHAAGLFVTPAIYFQFFMLFLPMVAVMTMGEIARLTLPHYSGQVKRRHRLLRIAFLSMPVLWFLLGFITLSWPRPVQDPYRQIDFSCLVLLVLASTLIVFHRRIAVWLLVGALALPSAGRIAIQHLYWSNEPQFLTMRNVDLIMEECPGESVMDGFTGFAYRYPHASYWWWINEHTLPMVETDARQPSLPTLLRQGVPALVILDDQLLRVPGLERALFEGYLPLDLPLGPNAVSWIRKDRFDRVKERLRTELSRSR